MHKNNIRKVVASRGWDWGLTGKGHDGPGSCYFPYTDRDLYYTGIYLCQNYTFIVFKFTLYWTLVNDIYQGEWTFPLPC